LGLLCKENSVATLANEWAFKLDPIIRKYNEGELDQVENTRNFAQNASADQLLPITNGRSGTEN
jgi:hypothetical protein